jgi:hypothetical protein
LLISWDDSDAGILQEKSDMMIPFARIKAAIGLMNP